MRFVKKELLIAFYFFLPCKWALNIKTSANKHPVQPGKQSKDFSSTKKSNQWIRDTQQKPKQSGFFFSSINYAIRIGSFFYGIVVINTERLHSIFLRVVVQLWVSFFSSFIHWTKYSLCVCVRKRESNRTTKTINNVKWQAQINWCETQTKRKQESSYHIVHL